MPPRAASLFPHPIDSFALEGRQSSEQRFTDDTPVETRRELTNISFQAKSIHIWG
ncbi:hypothetical protein ABH922_004731 [Rhodococcus sp. 27YEA15]